jgi:hypothetical protein
MVLGTTLIGTEPMVRDRLRVWRDAGVTTVRLYPAGDTLDERLTTLGRALDLVRGLDTSLAGRGDRVERAVRLIGVADHGEPRRADSAGKVRVPERHEINHITPVS